MSSISNFRNYTFAEENNRLIISKVEQRKSSDFLKLVQRYPCYKLVKDYTSHLQTKLSDLEGFNPKFTSPESKDLFQTWQREQRIKIGKKLANPIEALQENVAKRFEQLFQEKGERSVVFGCCHIREGELKQTQTLLSSPQPQHTNKKNESHSHEHAVCVDFRVDPLETLAFTIGDRMLFKDDSNPVHTHNSPDFSRINFEDPNSVSRLRHLKNVQKLHAERVPNLEKGVWGMGEEQNTFLVEQIRKSLAPGGVYTFDVGIGIPLMLEGDGLFLNFVDTCQKRAFHYAGNLEDKYEAKFKEVNANHEFLGALHYVISNKIVFADCSDDELKTALISEEVERRLKEEVKRDFFEKMRAGAKQFATNHQEKIRLSSDNICISWYSQGLPYLKFSLSEVRSGKATTAIEACSQRSPGRAERIKIIMDPHGRSFEELFAIYRQIECYNALDVDPDLNQELLPENKQLLDEMLKVWAQIMGRQLVAIGFENPTFILDAIHPENGRPFSCIISVRKPLEAN
jgi:hypothetical protein